MGVSRFSLSPLYASALPRPLDLCNGLLKLVPCCNSMSCKQVLLLNLIVRALPHLHLLLKGYCDIFLRVTWFIMIEKLGYDMSSVLLCWSCFIHLFTEPGQYLCSY